MVEYMRLWLFLSIVLVLFIIFLIASGIFSGTSSCNTACCSNPGFLCYGPVYNHDTGNIALTIGQETGTNWSNAIVMFAVQGTAITTNGGPNVTATAINTINGGLASKNTTLITWIGISNYTTIGKVIEGTVWACYTTTSPTVPITYKNGVCTADGRTVYYAQLASLVAKAT